MGKVRCFLRACVFLLMLCATAMAGDQSTLQSSESVIVRELRLKFLKSSDELLAGVRGLLTERGTANMIRALNVIVIKDTPAGVERVEGMIGRIDIMPAQIAIEAKIVEMDTARSRELGVSWGASNAEISGNVLGEYGSVSEGLSVALAPSSEDGGTFSFGVVTDKFSLDMKLQALEGTGVAHVLSNPRIIVLDNESASISSGSELVLPTFSGTMVINNQGGYPEADTRKNGTFSALLELKVTPRVSGAGRIAMGLNTKREEFDYSREVEGYPAKLSKTANTQLIVRDGATVVIGGIYTRNDSDSESRVPLLGRIPVLGWLFKHTSRAESQTELLIFLTPNILKPAPEFITNPASSHAP